jgi:WD40 repeat protein
VGQYDVTWSLKEGADAGTITTDGIYTAPPVPGTFHLIATSSHNTGLSATAPVKIVSVGFATVSEMVVPRSGQSATLLADGKVLVAGGTTDASHSADLFDPSSSSFVPTTGNMVYTRSGQCAALLPNGRVLIAGGGDSKGTLFKTAEVFDPATGTFTATGDLNQVRAGATATPLANGSVLIAGGQDSVGALLSSAELYDPSTGTFTLTGKMHTARARHTATLLPNGRVLLVGSVSATSNAEIFDPPSGTFTGTGSLFQARAHHTATLLPNGKVLVLGGTQIMAPVGGGAPPADVSLDTAEIYDPANGTFQTAGRLVAARDSHSATLLPNGMVLIAGGYTHDFDGDAQPEWYTMFTAELFDPATSVSTAAASLEGDRAEHVATLLNNGQVLVTGGIEGFQELCCSPNRVTTSVATAEVYK